MVSTLPPIGRVALTPPPAPPALPPRRPVGDWLDALAAFAGPVMPGYTYRDGRYYDAEDQALSRRDVEDVLGTLIDGTKDHIAAISKRRAEGLDPAEWSSAMSREIRNLHATAWALADGGFENITPKSRAALGARIGEQFDYLDGFQQALTDGDLAPDSPGALARALRYADAGWGTFQNAERAEALANGAAYARNILGESKESCAECLDLSDQGWIDIEDMPEVGDRACNGGCNCSIETAAAIPDEGAEGDDGDMAPFAARFDVAEEPRDEHGRWTDGGGSGEAPRVSDATQAAVEPLLAKAREDLAALKAQVANLPEGDPHRASWDTKYLPRQEQHIRDLEALLVPGAPVPVTAWNTALPDLPARAAEDNAWREELFRPGVTAEENKRQVAEALTARLAANPAYQALLHDDLIQTAVATNGPAFGYAEGDPRGTTAALIHEWARTSNASPMAQMLQRAVRDEFGLHSAWDSTALGGPPPANLYERLGPGLRAFVRAQYDETQDYLRHSGLVHDGAVTLYRGAHWDHFADVPLNVRTHLLDAGGPATDDEMAGMRGRITAVGETAAHLAPASSWSTSWRVADGFAHTGADNNWGLLAAARVPVAHILSTARTGFGAAEEQEMVVLGDRPPVRAAAWARALDGLRPNDDRLYREMATSTARFADTRGLTPLDTPLSNADWPKRTDDLPPASSDRAIVERLAWLGRPSEAFAASGRAAAFEWSEDAHPRDDHGRFAPEGGGTTTTLDTSHERAFAQAGLSVPPTRAETLALARTVAARLRTEVPGGRDPRKLFNDWHAGARTAPYRALREAARQQFGLPGEPAKEHPSASLKRSVAQIYQDTQAALADAGLKEVTLYRGMLLHPEQLPPGITPGHSDSHADVLHAARPLASWTSNPEAPAHYAATHHKPGMTPVVMTATFPASQVFSTPHTGPGLASKEEFIVLGGEQPVRMHTADAQGAWHFAADGPLPVVGPPDEAEEDWVRTQGWALYVADPDDGLRLVATPADLAAVCAELGTTPEAFAASPAGEAMPAALRTAAFYTEDQPRDEHGRWAAVGGEETALRDKEAYGGAVAGARRVGEERLGWINRTLDTNEKLLSDGHPRPAATRAALVAERTSLIAERDTLMARLHPRPEQVDSLAEASTHLRHAQATVDDLLAERHAYEAEHDAAGLRAVAGPLAAAGQAVAGWEQRVAVLAERTPPQGALIHDADADRIFEGTFGSAGYTTHVTATLAPGSDWTHVAGIVRDKDGHEIGEFGRSFYPQEGRVEHGLLRFNDPKNEGTGFAADFNAHAFNEYAQAGYHTVEVHADIDVGGYAWAKQGFDFDNEPDRHAMVDRLHYEAEMLGPGRAGPIKAAIEGLRRRLDTDHPPTALEMSEVGKQFAHPGEHGATWFGKEAMLGSDWHGVKHLDPAVHYADAPPPDRFAVYTAWVRATLARDGAPPLTRPYPPVPADAQGDGQYALYALATDATLAQEADLARRLVAAGLAPGPGYPGTGTAATAKAGFDVETEPRDERGRWTDGGGAGPAPAEPPPDGRREGLVAERDRAQRDLADDLEFWRQHPLTDGTQPDSSSLQRAVATAQAMLDRHDRLTVAAAAEIAKPSSVGAPLDPAVADRRPLPSWLATQQEVYGGDFVDAQGRSGQSVAAYQAAVEQHLHAVLNDPDTTLRVQVSPAKLGAILRDGSLKTAFEVNRRGVGLNAPDYLALRAQTEQQALSIAPTAPPAAHPVYGYFSGQARSPDTVTLQSYGTATLELKPAVKDRATFSVGDTLDDHTVPSPVAAPRWYSAQYRTGGTLDPRTAPVDRLGGRYTEAQIHGGVQTRDIARVVFAGPPAASVARALDKAGIPHVEYTPTVSAYPGHGPVPADEIADLRHAQEYDARDIARTRAAWEGKPIQRGQQKWHDLAMADAARREAAMPVRAANLARYERGER